MTAPLWALLALVPAPGVANASAPPAPANSLGASARLAYRPAPAGADVPPAWGFSLGASYERRWGALGPLDLAAGVDLFFDRFARDVQGSTPTNAGGELTFDGVRSVSHATFALAQLVGLRAGAWRPFAGAGPGVSIAYFTSDEEALRPGELRATLPFFRAIAGVHYSWRRDLGVFLRADYAHMLRDPTLRTDDGRELTVFGDLVDVGVGFTHAF